MSDLSGPRGEGLERDIHKARRLEWLSLAYLVSSVSLMVLVMSGSQALRTEFVGDLLSMIAPGLFLIGDRISGRPPTETFPFGFERAVSAGYLGAALALLAVGVFLFGDAGMKLVAREHPIIGASVLFGHAVWTGWLAIPVLIWAAIPSFFLGRAKRRIGKALHDKVLVADAQTNAANWQSAVAAMLGVLGVAFGFWWADAAAAVVISVEIVRDGLVEVRTALGDILDRRPRNPLDGKLDPLPERLTAQLRAESWVRDAVVRVRERGREFTAEAFVVPHSEEGLLEHLDRCARTSREMDPRLREIVFAPMTSIPPEIQSIRADQPPG